MNNLELAEKLYSLKLWENVFPDNNTSYTKVPWWFVYNNTIFIPLNMLKEDIKYHILWMYAEISRKWISMEEYWYRKLLDEIYDFVNNI